MCTEVEWQWEYTKEYDFVAFGPQIFFLSSYIYLV